MAENTVLGDDPGPAAGPGESREDSAAASVPAAPARTISGAEHHARRQAAQLDSLLEHAPLGFAFFDREHRYVRINDELCRINGLPAEAHIGRRISEVLPLNAKAVDPILDRVFETGEAVQCEIAGETPAEPGVLRHWLTGFYPVRTGDIEITEVGAFVLEISLRKRMEEALRQSEARFRRVIDHMHDALIIDDASGKVVFANAQFCQLFGIPEEEVRSVTLEDYVAPEWRAELRDRHERRIAGESVPDRFEYEGIRRDGTRMWLEVRVVALTDECGRVTGTQSTIRDISERRAVEQALRESEHRYRALFESMQEGFHLSEIICDEAGKPIDWRFLAVNSKFEAICGMRREQIAGRRYREVFSGSNCDYWVACFGEVALSQAPRQFETEDFGRRWRIIAYSPRKGQFAVILNDVTEHTEAEAALRESEARARARLAEIEAIYESAPIGLCVFDTGLRWVRLNKHMAEMNGLPIEQHIGRRPSEVLPGTGEQAEKVLRAMIEREDPFLEFELSGTTPARPGVVRWWNERLVLLKDEQGRVIGISVATQEITERKLAEEERRRSEERERARAAELEAVMEAVPVPILIARDPECREMFGSRLTYELLRMPPGSNLSLASAEALSTYRVVKDGRDVPFHELPVQKAAFTGQPVRDYEFDIVFQDGSVHNVVAHAVPLHDAEGHARGAVAAIIDLTERKRNEERLRQTQKLESVGLLAGGIAHDFNNLLTGIMGNASMVLEEVSPETGERLREVINSAERAANLTRQLLAYSGKGQFVIREIDISEAVHDISPLVKLSIPKSVELEMTVQKRLPPVRMDPGQLQQILMNLVINAAEAISEGHSGKVTVATSVLDVDQPFVDALGEEVRPGRYACIEVADTGSGISEELRSRIFDPFFTTKFTGRGLGLAAVAGIVRSQKGAITVESRPGRGTRFRVLLPAVSRSMHGAEPEPGGSGSRGVVMIVEDEGSVRDMIRAVLRKHGYRVLVAADVQEALAELEREGAEVDLVILDVVMPAMVARDVLPAIKAQSPNVRVLLTSGYREWEARMLCTAFPGSTFIQKPYTAQQILAAVEAAMAAKG